MGAPIDAVVFDFDGLILDTEITSYQAWAETFARYGGTLTRAEFAEAIGTHWDPWAALSAHATLPLPPEGEVRAAKRARDNEMLMLETVQPGVVEWLEEAVALGLKRAVASSSPTSWVEPHLTRLGLRGQFALLSCCDGDRPPKPAPDVYLAACDALGVDPARALAVEDSANGLLAAKAAGMWCVAVPSDLTRHLDFSSADVQLSSLADASIRDVIATIGGRG